MFAEKDALLQRIDPGQLGKLVSPQKAEHWVVVSGHGQGQVVGKDATAHGAPGTPSLDLQLDVSVQFDALDQFVLRVQLGVLVRQDHRPEALCPPRLPPCQNQSILCFCECLCLLRFRLVVGEDFGAVDQRRQHGAVLVECDFVGEGALPSKVAEPADGAVGAGSGAVCLLGGLVGRGAEHVGHGQLGQVWQTGQLGGQLGDVVFEVRQIGQVGQVRVLDGVLDLLVGGYAVGRRGTKGIQGDQEEKDADEEQLEATRRHAQGERAAQEGVLGGHCGYCGQGSIGRSEDRERGFNYRSMGSSGRRRRRRLEENRRPARSRP